MNLKEGTDLQNGRYTILGTLGQGGFGITYKASQKGLDRMIAVKEFYMNDICLRDEQSHAVTLSSTKSQDLWDGFKNKFIKEAKTIASLNHPNIVKIIDVFEENGTAYYAMEYISGGSLKTLVKANGVYHEKDALTIINEVGDALAYIHSKNILHLDIKPDNIMMKDGNTPIIIDFGISKRYDETGSQTSTMQTGRSRGYAPIEQYKHGGLSSFSPATDVYSLAATLYYILGGQRPPEPSDIYDSGLPVLPDISGETMGCIIKGMAVKKAQRPQTVEEFISMLGITQPAADTGFNVAQYRSLIETLEENKDYKEAYNRCLDAIEHGNDVEYSRAKASDLIDIMRRKNNTHSIVSVIIAIAVSIAITLLYILI